ncbi:hypothetical protein [Gleimia europaea]|uniref:hypothetical protein n=1 Tax=Gleimia europaea TaxID=66228 RepID=UPI0027D7BA74|nr:hypothetical protein [Gleimia europaea]
MHTVVMNVSNEYECSGSKDLLTGREAAALLPRTSYARLMRWARDRKVPYVEDPGGRRFFVRADIEQLLTRVPARDDGVLPGGDSGEC